MKQITAAQIDLQSLFPQNQFPVPQAEIQFIQNGTIYGLAENQGNGFVTVTTNQDRTVILIVTPNTVLRNQYLQSISFGDLTVGMNVMAAFSTRMTYSQPPQAVAYSMIAFVEPPFMVSTGIVSRVNTRTGQLTTGVWNNINRQMIYNVNNETEIFNRRHQRITLSQIRPGSIVRIEHAVTQTASIPPQTTAFRIDVIS